MPGTRLFVVIAGLSLAGCSIESGLPSDLTQSGIRSVSGGEVSVQLDSEYNDSVTSVGVGTVAYMTGIDVDRGQIEAYSGIAPGHDVGPDLAVGTATYTASYEYVVVDNVDRTFNLPSGQQGLEEGSIVLTADIASGTLTGRTSELEVDGTFSGGTLDGRVTANYAYGVTPFGPDTIIGSLDGDLEGFIGQDGVIGAFHGNDSDTVMSGGVVGQRN